MKSFNVSLDNALEVYSLFLGQRHGLGISDLSRLTGMYKSRIFRIVKTFEKHEFLQFDTATAKYQPGPRLKLFSFMEDGKDLPRLVHGVLERLSKDTSATVILRKRIGWELLTVDVAISDHPLRIAAEHGKKYPVTFGAPGKIFIAYNNPSLAEALKHYRHQFPRFTSKSLTDPEKWQQLIPKVRQRGYSFSDDEAILGGRAVGLPVLNPAGDLIASLSLAMPKALFPMRQLRRIVAKGKQASQTLAELLANEF